MNLIKALHRFLREHKIENTFKHNSISYVLSNPNRLSYMNLIKYRLQDDKMWKYIFMDAFDWSKTVEGREYWDRINRKWCATCRLLR